MKKVIVSALIIVLAGLLPVQAQTVALQYCPDTNSRAIYWLEDLTDQTSNGYTLTNHNSVGFVTGDFNNAADLGASNTNKFLDAHSALGWTGGDVSISLWVKMRAEPTDISAPGSESLVHLWYGSGGGSTKVWTVIEYGKDGANYKLRISRNDMTTRVNGDYIVDLGTSNWHHIVLTYNGTSGVGKLYLDGADTGATFTQTGTGANAGISGDDFNIGAFGMTMGNPQYLFASAYFDEVVVSSNVFSSTDVSNIYNRVNPPINCSLSPPLQLATEATLQAVKSKTDNLDVLLSSRASELTLQGVKTGTDKLDTNLSTRASETALSNIANKLQTLIDGDNWQRAAKNGKGFIATTNEITITPATETNFLLIRNPAASGKLHRSNYLALTVRTEGQNVRLRIYKNPTVTADGAPVVVNNVRTTGNAPVSQVFSQPTTTISGQLIAAYSRNSDSLDRPFDLSLYLEQGESYLITVQGTATGNDYMLTYTFVEE